MNQQAMNTILRIDASAGQGISVTREIGDEVVRRLVAQQPTASVVNVDLAHGMPHIDAAWIGASFTPAGQRDLQQRARLAVSDDAIRALKQADAIVLTAPVYNFSVPSTLKAWIDHVCRAGITFRYTDKGPEGLLRDRPVYLVMASGGVPFGSAADFASTYLRQVLRFIGIEDVRLIGAERVAADAAAARESALGQLDKWLPGLAGQAA